MPGFEDGTLGIIFADLRQLLDLFESFDWSTYLADFGQDRSKYIRVQPQTVVVVLEKYEARSLVVLKYTERRCFVPFRLVELEKKKNSLFGKGKDKDRKKLLDTVLKQLRTLANSTHG